MGRFRLEELVEWSQRILPREAEGESRRVRWMPNPRLVRYYTTLGLIDRPAEMRGRTAYYDRRHLVQIAAIKVLQAHGASLQEVQQRLAGLPDGELEEIAGLPRDWDHVLEAVEAPARVEGDGGEDRFWEAVPDLDEDPLPAVPRTTLDPSAGPEGPNPWVGIDLDPGVMLLVRGMNGAHDLEALREAARPLLQYLRRGSRETPVDPRPAREEES